jgi:hypothetical protein
LGCPTEKQKGYHIAYPAVQTAAAVTVGTFIGKGSNILAYINAFITK